jgi:hypothetical protein
MLLKIYYLFTILLYFLMVFFIIYYIGEQFTSEDQVTSNRSTHIYKEQIIKKLSITHDVKPYFISRVWFMNIYFFIYYSVNKEFLKEQLKS